MPKLKTQTSKASAKKVTTGQVKNPSLLMKIKLNEEELDPNSSPE